MIPPHWVSEQLQNILKGDSEQLEAILHVGGNNIGRKMDVILQSEY